MIDQIIVIYCICDEVTKCLNIKDDTQCKMSTPEIMTFALIASIMYGCDYKKTRLISLYFNLFRNIISYSQIVRRIHQIPEHVWKMTFLAIRFFLIHKESKFFIVDSFPVKAYQNHKSFRAKIFKGKEYHGYTASKKEYFFGIKVHMVVDLNGVPVEFMFTPGSFSDIKTLEDFNLDIPKNSYLLADKSYTNYSFEDRLKYEEGINLLSKRRCNLKRKHSPTNDYILSRKRNYIETVFSSILSRCPRYIRARTEKGFCLKVMFLIISYMINLYYPVG